MRNRRKFYSRQPKGGHDPGRNNAGDIACGICPAPAKFRCKRQNVQGTDVKGLLCAIGENSTLASPKAAMILVVTMLVISLVAFAPLQQSFAANGKTSK